MAPDWLSGEGGADASAEAVSTDAQLLDFLRSGDHGALGELFRRYAGLIRAVAARILNDIEEAEDVVQDVFLFLQRKCSVFDRTKSSARSWIVQMTYQRAIERRRYLSTRQFYKGSDDQTAVERVVGTTTGEIDYSAEAVFGRNGLQKVMNEMSEAQRETLRLYFFDGYSLAEISEKLHQPLGNVRHHYYRGLDKLRKQMFGRSVRGS